MPFIKLFHFVFNALKNKPYLEATDKAILNKFVVFYTNLNPTLKPKFEQEVANFLDEVPIYFKETPPIRALEILVAASAVMIIFGKAFSYRDQLTQVVIYHEAVTRYGSVFSIGELRETGDIVEIAIAAKALISSFRITEDMVHVGIHEFMHLLDKADGKMDGVPNAIMPEEWVEKWKDLAQSEIARIKLNQSSIRAYGATNDLEFLTVCSEYFFERPKQLQKEHPEIFEILSKTFHHDIVEG